jgi:hypothetical protein
MTCIDYQKFTDANKAVPTTEHYDPLLCIHGITVEKIAVFNKAVVWRFLHDWICI